MMPALALPQPTEAAGRKEGRKPGERPPAPPPNNGRLFDRTFGERPRGSKIVRAEGQINAQFTALASVPPEVLEPVLRQGRVDRGAGDRSMAEPCLDCPSVVPLVGEGVPAGMAEHGRMRLQVEAGTGGGTLDQPGEAPRDERGSPLADEDKRRGLAPALEPTEGPELVAAQGANRTCRLPASGSRTKHSC
jgi:hypothetical protein